MSIGYNRACMHIATNVKSSLMHSLMNSIQKKADQLSIRFIMELLACLLNFLVLALIQQDASCEILRLECETYANFSVVHENTRQNNGTFQRLVDTDELTCKFKCSRERECKSINVNVNEDICELNNKSANDPMDKVKTISSLGWSFYSPSFNETLVGINCRKLNPCEENSKCIDTCECPGYRCIDSSTIFSSCYEALTINFKTAGTFRIQHTNMDRFVVAECSLEKDNLIAIFHHNSERTTEVNGYEAPGSYKKSIIYHSNQLDDLKKFVDSSVSCRQFTRIECHSMVTLYNNYGFLVDRIGNRMPYFGGGPTDGEGCKCGITNSCATSGKLCNCDTNDMVWRYDEGYVTDKLRLPLMEVRLGDTGGNTETGRFVVGILECTESPL